MFKSLVILLFVIGRAGSSSLLTGLTCSSESVNQANAAQLHSILSELADSTFFRLVRVSYDGVCPLTSGQEGPTCGTVPPPTANLWGAPAEQPSSSLCGVDMETSAKEFASSIVTNISPSEQYAQREFPRDNECVVEGTFSIRPDYWLDMCDGLSVGEYVNLRLNPERNTGYNGARVWEEMHAIVNQLNSPEGEILKRIISGYHTLVTVQILSNYYPPKNGGLWTPHTEKLRALIQQHPEYIENMQFAFVVMARSLFKIRDHLYSYPFTTGNVTEDTQTISLVEHLLDSAVLSSCGSVVLSGFDESVLFSSSSPSISDAATRFKKTFRKLSQLTNCVSCKRCRLHASVAVHGIGAGLKILLSRSELVAPSLSRDDIVALMNVVHKFSDSIELVNRFEAPQTSLKEVALTEVKRLGSKLTAVQRDGLVHAILSEESNVMLLAKNLIGDPHMSFVRHALIYLGLETPDCIVIGGGLAGLVTALSVAERGGSVTIIEKQSALGGNSAKASSGINSVRSNRTEDIEEFFVDTVKSQNHLGVEQLAHILVERANVSVAWLERVSGVALNSVGQLGGHRFARTWKPEHGLVGAEIMGGLIRAVKKSFPSIQVLTASRVVELVQSEETVQGVRLADGRELHARTVVLASGGFGFDTSGLIQAYRPDLVSFPTTLGSQTTGDGIKLAVSVGADLMDMQHVQLHPTGFIDPADRDNRVKVLAAEILRGIGGILLDENGNRFVNELGTRKHVTDVMLEKCKGKSERCAFTILIGERSVDAAENILRVYQNRGLLKRVSRSELSENVLTTLKEYSVSDKFGRVDKQGIPIDTNEWFLIGQVTPVVHYTMGGVRVDTQGRVTRMDGSVIQGLFAVGEVTGGVHGENRLGGNSLLECTVYGRIIGGSSVPVVTELTPSHFPRQPVHVTVKAPVVVRTMKLAEVEAHATVDDCWTVIEHKVYDLSRYADEHPGGAAAVRESCGKDATQRFLAAHSLGLLDDVGFESIGDISRE